jgi:hypothetical protein
MSGHSLGKLNDVEPDKMTKNVMKQPSMKMVYPFIKNNPLPWIKKYHTHNEAQSLSLDHFVSKIEIKMGLHSNN